MELVKLFDGDALVPLSTVFSCVFLLGCCGFVLILAVGLFSDWCIVNFVPIADTVETRQTRHESHRIVTP